MIDSHAHFYTPQFQEQDIPTLAAAARAVGVQAIVTVPETLEDCKAVLALAHTQPIVQPCAGLHPVQPVHEIGQYYSSCRSVQDVSEVQPVLDFIRRNAEQLVAIGEIGLDFSPHVVGDNATLREVQQAVFQQQIHLANELGLPVNVHSRSAGHYAVEALLTHGARGAVLHAFDGKLGHALKGAQAGYYFSIPPSVIRSPQKQKLVKGLPLDRLLLETDSPALGPEKSGVNVPANIQISCAEIASIKGVAVADVQQITTENALKLFPRLRGALEAAAEGAGH